MKLIRTLFVVLLLLIPFFAATVPPNHPVVSQVAPDAQWNRYTTKDSNFEILSIDDAKGKYLNDNIDSVKSWLLTRWALPNDNFPVKCKVVCVPTKEMFNEFFAKDSPQLRVTKGPGGQITEITIWLSADDPRWNTSVLTKVLTEACLQELEIKWQVKLPFWIHRGMPIVNSSLPELRQSLGNLSLIFDRNLRGYTAKEILTMTPEALAAQPTDSRVWFDSESSALLLMFYKEYGAKKFNLFLAQCRSNTPDVALRDVYGFKSYDEADAVFKKYIYNLSNDITGKGQKVTPNSYLTWPIP